jgi:hypothetical protein
MVMLRLAALVLAISGFMAIPTQLPAAEGDKPHPQEQLDTTIEEMARLLKAKEYRRVIAEFVLPAELEEIKKTQDLDGLAESFGKGKAGEVLGLLQKLKTMKPEMLDGETQAVFTFKQVDGLEKTMRFFKVEKKWYLSNRTS